MSRRRARRLGGSPGPGVQLLASDVAQWYGVAGVPGAAQDHDRRRTRRVDDRGMGGGAPRGPGGAECGLEGVHAAKGGRCLLESRERPRHLRRAGDVSVVEAQHCRGRPGRSCPRSRDRRATLPGRTAPSSLCHRRGKPAARQCLDLPRVGERERQLQGGHRVPASQHPAVVGRKRLRVPPPPTGTGSGGPPGPRSCPGCSAQCSGSLWRCRSAVPPRPRVPGRARSRSMTAPGRSLRRAPFGRHGGGTSRRTWRRAVPRKTGRSR